MYYDCSTNECHDSNLKIAVVSDAISDGAYFHAWKNYYAQTVGDENIFVFSYQRLPGCIFVNHRYCDSQRKKLITYFVANLLNTYDYVIRVDIDEFLVPMTGTLKEYILSMTQNYVTANGFNVFQADEPALDFSKPLLRQRKFMYASGTVNKTCITQIPLEWSQGFHFCNHPPMFNGLCLLHMKHADRDTKNMWDSMMAANSTIIGVYNHYTRVEADRMTLPIDDNIVRDEFNKRFLEYAQERNGTFKSTLASETINLIIPEAVKVF